MRPLIEILEDERTLTQKLESVYRYMLRDDDPEIIDILTTQKGKIERDIEGVRNEIREYFLDLLK